MGETADVISNNLARQSQLASGINTNLAARVSSKPARQSDSFNNVINMVASMLDEKEGMSPQYLEALQYSYAYADQANIKLRTADESGELTAPLENEYVRGLSQFDLTGEEIAQLMGIVMPITRSARQAAYESYLATQEDYNMQIAESTLMNMFPQRAGVEQQIRDIEMTGDSALAFESITNYVALFQQQLMEQLPNATPTQIERARNMAMEPLYEAILESGVAAQDFANWQAGMQMAQEAASAYNNGQMTKSQFDVILLEAERLAGTSLDSLDPVKQQRELNEMLSSSLATRDLVEDESKERAQTQYYNTLEQAERVDLLSAVQRLIQNGDLSADQVYYALGEHPDIVKAVEAGEAMRQIPSMDAQNQLDLSGIDQQRIQNRLSSLSASKELTEEMFRLRREALRLESEEGDPTLKSLLQSPGLVTLLGEGALENFQRLYGSAMPELTEDEELALEQLKMQALGENWAREYLNMEGYSGTYESYLATKISQALPPIASGTGANQQKLMQIAIADLTASTGVDPNEVELAAAVSAYEAAANEYYQESAIMRDAFLDSLEQQYALTQQAADAEQALLTVEGIIPYEDTLNIPISDALEVFNTHQQGITDVYLQEVERYTNMTTNTNPSNGGDPSRFFEMPQLAQTDTGAIVPFAPHTDWTLTSPYGVPRGDRTHMGVDLAAPGGTDVIFYDFGVVESAGYVDGYGYDIVIKTRNGEQHSFSHLIDMPPLGVGEQVLPGDIVGFVGSTGNSSGNHLHWEIRVDGAHVDPLEHVLMNYTNPRRSNRQEQSGLSPLQVGEDSIADGVIEGRNTPMPYGNNVPMYSSYISAFREDYTDLRLPEGADGHYSLGRDVISAINDLAEDLDIPALWIVDVLGGESSWNPSAANGAYSGLIQFSPENAAQFGYTPGMGIVEQLREPVKGYLQAMINEHGAIETVYHLMLAIWYPVGMQMMNSPEQLRGISDGHIVWEDYSARVGSPVGRQYEPLYEDRVSIHLTPTVGCTTCEAMASSNTPFVPHDHYGDLVSYGG